MKINAQYELNSKNIIKNTEFGIIVKGITLLIIVFELITFIFQFIVHNLDP